MKGTLPRLCREDVAKYTKPLVGWLRLPGARRGITVILFSCCVGNRDAGVIPVGVGSPPSLRDPSLLCFELGCGGATPVGFDVLPAPSYMYPFSPLGFGTK